MLQPVHLRKNAFTVLTASWRAPFVHRLLSPGTKPDDCPCLTTNDQPTSESLSEALQQESSEPLLRFASANLACPGEGTFQVKIWFQNKRSKFKKLLKQGSNPHESDPLPGSAALSPRSPALPPVWDVSASAKGVNMPPNSYMPGYSHWYSSPHQDTMQRPQMM
nr:PREDICTED: homeobox protein DLX-6 [Opisthocomus hoazin]